MGTLISQYGYQEKTLETGKAVLIRKETAVTQSLPGTVAFTCITSLRASQASINFPAL